ncbi:MAG: hypothetical protein QXD61_10040 [Candidatus Caldarchaeum sp.]
MRRLPQLMITTVILLSGLIIVLAVTPSQNKATVAMVTRNAPDFTLTVVDVNGLTNRSFKPDGQACVDRVVPALQQQRLYQAYVGMVVFIIVAGGYRWCVGS